MNTSYRTYTFFPDLTPEEIRFSKLLEERAGTAMLEILFSEILFPEVDAAGNIVTFPALDRAFDQFKPDLLEENDQKHLVLCLLLKAFHHQQREPLKQVWGPAYRANPPGWFKGYKAPAWLCEEFAKTFFFGPTVSTPTDNLLGKLSDQAYDSARTHFTIRVVQFTLSHLKLWDVAGPNGVREISASVLAEPLGETPLTAKALLHHEKKIEQKYPFLANKCPLLSALLFDVPILGLKSACRRYADQRAIETDPDLRPKPERKTRGKLAS